MIDLRYTNAEEIRHMNEHKWIESEKRGYDVGEFAYFDWIQKYAISFREWVENIPSQCIKCNPLCRRTGPECIDPFNEHRLTHFMRLTSSSDNNMHS